MAPPMLAGLPANIPVSFASAPARYRVLLPFTQKNSDENIIYLVFWQSINRLVRRSHIACGPRFTHRNKPLGKAS